MYVLLLSMYLELKVDIVTLKDSIYGAIWEDVFLHWLWPIPLSALRDGFYPGKSRESTGTCTWRHETVLTTFSWKSSLEGDSGILCLLVHMSGHLPVQLPLLI